MYQFNLKRARNVAGDSAGRTAPILMIRRCECCARLLAPLFDMCSSCHSSDLEWVPSSGVGSIMSWRVLHRAANPRSEVKRSTIAIVELDDGPWLYTTIQGELPPSSAAPVRVRFHARPGEDRFPVFAINLEARTSERVARPA
ncbi:Zn-ribbon domain-containing OB-fold protein [Nocardia sp. NPDC003999]